MIGGDNPSGDARKVNVLTGLDHLLQRWDFHELAADSKTLEATPPSTGATIYPRTDPRFIRSLEPLVARLVLAITDVLGLITYSSCEGHSTDVGDEVAAVRHVGIVPRDTIEDFERLEFLRKSAADLSTPQAPDDCLIRIVKSTLVADGRPIDAYDVVFQPRGSCDWPGYLRAANRLTELLVDRVCAELRWSHITDW